MAGDFEDRARADEMRAKAKAGQQHPDADMVGVKAIAGFELADVFAEWARREEAERGAFSIELERCGGLGPPWRMFRQGGDHGTRLTFEWAETPEAYGERCARAVLKLLKEV